MLGIGALAAVLMAAFLALEARIENPIMPLRILRLRGLVNASLVRGFLVTGMYSTFFLGTLYLEHVRHYSALQTGAAFLPWTLTVAVLSQGITARLVDAVRAAPACSRRAWRAPSPACSCSPPSGPDTALLPDDLLRLLRDRPRHRQRVHAAADARDGRRPARRTPGSAPGSPTSPSRSAARSGWPCSARSPPTTPRACCPTTTGVTSSLIGGYQVAFLAGAATIAAGIVLAFALLRPRPHGPRFAEVPARVPSTVAIEEQAA